MLSIIANSLFRSNTSLLVISSCLEGSSTSFGQVHHFQFACRLYYRKDPSPFNEYLAEKICTYVEGFFEVGIIRNTSNHVLTWPDTLHILLPYADDLAACADVWK